MSEMVDKQEAERYRDWLRKQNKPPKEQVLDPDRAVRAARYALREQARMLRKLNEKFNDPKFEELARSLLNIADRLTPVIDLLSPSRAVRLWNKGTKQAFASISPTAYQPDLKKRPYV